MKLQHMMIGLLAAMLACTAFATSASATLCTSGVDSNEQCKTAAGPATVDIADGTLSLGLSDCQTIPTVGSILPLFCDASTGLSAAGGIAFDTDGSGPGSLTFNSGDNQVVITVQYNNDGVCGVANGPGCGFFVLAGNDRDHTGDATNVGAANDQLWTTTATAGTASLTECAAPGVLGANDWQAGQILVFIGVEIGTAPGVSVGTFDVKLEDESLAGPAADPDGISCSSGTSGATQETGCIWEHDVTENINLDDALVDLDPTGTDFDPVGGVTDVADAITGFAGGAPADLSGSGNCSTGIFSSYTCVGGTEMIVFVIGVGSTTETGCTTPSPLTAAFPGVPINEAAITGSSFTCSYTWTGAAAGGCLFV